MVPSVSLVILRSRGCGSDPRLGYHIVFFSKTIYLHCLEFVSTQELDHRPVSNNMTKSVDSQKRYSMNSSLGVHS